MKILLIGDKESTYLWDYFDYEKFKDIEFIISTGDLKSAYLQFLVTMLNVPLYYVPGNHDKNYLTNPPEGCINGDSRLIKHNDIKMVGFGGSLEYNGGTFQFTEKQILRRYKKLRRKINSEGGIDILFAHAPAFELNDGKDVCHQGFKTFIEIIDKYNPKYFIHGHQHLNYNIQSRVLKYKQTTIINTYEYYVLDYDLPPED
ncbi:MAG: metallophosphoesterase [Spirochaetes bacterium]|nr:metallophosphoesterase [Spirochaetota bacterium]